MMVKSLNIILIIALLPFTITYLLFKLSLDVCHNIGKHLPRIIYWSCFLCLFPFWIVIKMCCLIYTPVYEKVYKELWVAKKMSEYEDSFHQETEYDDAIDIEYNIKVNLVYSDDEKDDYFNSDEYKMRQELSALKRKYDPILKKHFALHEEIGQAYSAANNYTGFDSKEMLLCVQKCNEDFELIPDVLEFYRKEKKIYNKYGIERPDYTACPYSVKRMLIIMEKMNKYDDALILCQWALDHGLTRDGTEGGIIGRMARINKKREN